LIPKSKWLVENLELYKDSNIDIKDLSIGIDILDTVYGYSAIFLKCEMITRCFLNIKELVSLDLLKQLLKLNQDKGE